MCLNAASCITTQRRTKLGDKHGQHIRNCVYGVETVRSRGTNLAMPRELIPSAQSTPQVVGRRTARFWTILSVKSGHFICSGLLPRLRGNVVYLSSFAG